MFSVKLFFICYLIFLTTCLHERFRFDIKNSTSDTLVYALGNTNHEYISPPYQFDSSKNKVFNEYFILPNQSKNVIISGGDETINVFIFRDDLYTYKNQRKLFYKRAYSQKYRLTDSMLAKMNWKLEVKN
ncbi:MAG: hypothetical protein KA797_02685 [Chitinophagales bacterium]|nr:hypothetical protein [Chitinophagales bacterium]